MGGKSRQKKSSGSSFSLFSLFKGKNSRGKWGEESRDYYDYLKAYKVYPSDEDRVGWVADPCIDKKASAYISSTTDKWGKLAYPN